jgi:hypothetical protein
MTDELNPELCNEPLRVSRTDVVRCELRLPHEGTHASVDGWEWQEPLDKCLQGDHFWEPMVFV